MRRRAPLSPDSSLSAAGRVSYGGGGPTDCRVTSKNFRREPTNDLGVNHFALLRSNSRQKPEANAQTLRDRSRN